MYVYSFGAPGHGKGPFDGLGGTIKNKIHSLIKATKTSNNEGVPGVDSGYINDVNDVFQAAQHYFENDYVYGRSRSRNPVNHFKFFSYMMDTDPIQRPDEAFSQLCQISKNYQFVVQNAGVVCMRQRSCWCLPCISALMQPALDWVDPHSIDGCVSSKYETTTAYDFTMETCTKKKGADVRKTIAERKASSREMASNLTPGTWMLFASSDVEQPIWLGRAMTKPEWGNACIWKNETRKKQKIGGGEGIQPGGYAINVQWYTHTEVGSLLYRIEKEEPHPLVQADVFLLHSGFEMTQVVGARANVPRSRSVRYRRKDDENGYAVPRLNLQTREGDWFRRDFGNIYQIDDVDRNRGLEGVKWY